MATQTLVEAKKLINNDIINGVVGDIISVNPIYDELPFNDYAGQAILVNRENALGDADFYSVGDTITAKAAATFTQVPFSATKIIGDAELDNLVKITSGSAGVDQMAIEISSKAKSIGRKFQGGMFTGSGAAPDMNSLHTLCDAAQYTTASAGQALSFTLLDELLALVKAKDGQVDFITMSQRTLRTYKALLRALGGATINEVVKLAGGRSVLGYENIPVFVSDFLGVTETANGAALAGGALTSVYAGCFDDGSEKVGVAGIHPTGCPAGVMVEPVGVHQSKDESIVRVKMYANLVTFNRKGLARLTSINN